MLLIIGSVRFVDTYTEGVSNIVLGRQQFYNYLSLRKNVKLAFILTNYMEFTVSDILNKNCTIFLLFKFIYACNFTFVLLEKLTFLLNSVIITLH